MKIAVFGASGLLGSAVCRSVIRRGYSLLAYSNKASVTFSDQYRTKQIPFSADNQLTRELFDQWPGAVINCAAISSPDTVDKSPESSRLINVGGASRLASISAHIGARFVPSNTISVEI